MTSAPPLDLDALSLDELKKLVVQLLRRVAVLEEENQRLRAEVARLKGLPKRPKLAPGSLDQASKSGPALQSQKRARRRPKRQSGRRTPPVTEDRTLVVEVPPGSHRRGFETFTVQDACVNEPWVLRSFVCTSQRRRSLFILCGGEHPVAQKVESGAAVHGSFDDLQPVDLPLDWTGAPRQRQGGMHGIAILTKAASEALEAPVLSGRDPA